MREEESWAETEFGNAALGDIRRTARLVELARTLSQRPSASLPEASEDAAQLKASYRFFGNEHIASEAMRASHTQATYARARVVPRVLAVQDTSYLDWSQHPATRGLGPLAQATQQGLLVHTTLAFTPERLPLGLLAQQVWAREATTFGQQEDHKTRAIEAKESQKWLTSLTAVGQARQVCPTTHWVSVGDREADVYDLFLVERPTGVDLLVRAARDRRVDDPTHRLWAAVAAEPVTAQLTLALPRRGEQPARNATLEVHWRAVTLRPPKHRAAEQLPTVRVWAIWAVEVTPPAGVEPVEWLLLTTLACQTNAEALERLDWYACRWGIEVWHKILKSGCQIEARQLHSAERLIRCLTLYSVIAWRILYAVMLARVVPETPCTALLEDEEWQALVCAIQRVATPTPTPPTLRQAVRWIAQLGGFPGRTHDGEPGVTVLWKGFQHLADLTYMYRILRPHPAPKIVGKA